MKAETNVFDLHRSVNGFETKLK